MPAASLSQIVRYCDRVLRTEKVRDYEGAANGLQVQNDGRVRRIAAAVDATLSTIQLAIAAKAELLVVHHGLFWNPSHPWTGQRYELFRQLVENNLAIYSSHLPLDMHRTFGNNVLLCRALGFKKLRPFFYTKEQYLGYQTQTSISRTELVSHLAAAVAGPVKLLPGGDSTCRRIGVVTGGAGSELRLAAAEGVDTFITGEGPHWTFGLAQELKLNVLYAGHYATETFGVKALARHLSERFRLPWSFIDLPSGL